MLGRRKTPKSPGSETTMTNNNNRRSPKNRDSISSARDKEIQKGGIDHVGNGITEYTAYVKKRPEHEYTAYAASPFSREEELVRKLLESDQASETSSVQGVIARIHHRHTINTNNYITNVYQNKFFLICLIILIMTVIYSNNRNYSDNSPLSKLESLVRFQFWQTDDNTFKIKHIVEGKGNVLSGDDNDTVLTIDDLKAIIMDEVKNCMGNSGNIKSNEPNPDFFRSLINSEVKSICLSELKKETSQIKSETQRYRGRKQERQELLDLIRKEAKDIVSQELLVFSQDKLNRPDFALHSGGAKVISRFTSKTYELWPEKWYQRLFAYVSGQGILRGKPPVTAISPDINVGQCWPFPGQDGQIAVLLNRRVYVTAVTYDHVSKRVAVDVLSAPKEFEVWGIIDDGTGGRTKNTKNIDYEDDGEGLFMESKEEDCGFRQDGEYVPNKNNDDDDNNESKSFVDIDQSLENFWGIIDDGTGGRTKNTKNIDYEDDGEGLFMESKEEDCGFRQDGEYVPNKNNDDDDNNESKSFVDIDQSLENITTGDLKLGTSSLHLFLGRYTYDIEGLPIQTFEVPSDLRKDNKPVRAVIMKINSNWGKPGYTCLYRFRVHGDPVDKLEN
ncbi:928_t:CDS:2 [Entrophospora sp. SA101]|nr:928_t:CDS:2 [Entrophospora sp. SA101]